MSTKNDITGDTIISKASTDLYRTNWDAIFNNGKVAQTNSSEQPCLYSFFVGYDQMGDLEGLFIALPSEVENVLGKMLHFGEVLGKHSDVSVKFRESHVNIISSEQDKIEWLRDLLGDTVSGFNPIEQYYEQLRDGGE